MRIAIPSESDQGLESLRSGHFGHAPFMTIVTIEGADITKVESFQNAEHDAVGCGGVIDYVTGLKVDGILTVGMGRPPFTRFTQNGIKVYIDTHNAKVVDAAKTFAQGNREEMTLAEVCNHH